MHAVYLILVISTAIVTGIIYYLKNIHVHIWEKWSELTDKKYTTNRISILTQERRCRTCGLHQIIRINIKHEN